MREHQGRIEGAGLRIAVVVSRFNRAVTGSLLDGAIEALKRHGVDEGAIEVFHVPGAFELTVAAEGCAASRRFDAIICLGAVVRGETPHFEYISGSVSQGLTDVSRGHRIPVAFGVLTTDTMEQALARSGDGHGNKGFESAVTALEMAGLLRAIDKSV